MDLDLTTYTLETYRQLRMALPSQEKAEELYASKKVSSEYKLTLGRFAEALHAKRDYKIEERYLLGARVPCIRCDASIYLASTPRVSLGHSFFCPQCTAWATQAVTPKSPQLVVTQPKRRERIVFPRAKVVNSRGCMRQRLRALLPF